MMKLMVTADFYQMPSFWEGIWTRVYVIMVCNLGGYSLLWVPIVKSDQEWFLPSIHDECLENRHSVIRVDTAIWTDAVFSNLMAGGITVMIVLSII